MSENQRDRKENNMKGSLSIRNMDLQVVAGLDQLARKRGKSREALIREICRKEVELEGMQELERSFSTMQKRQEELFCHVVEVLERNSHLLEKLSLFLIKN